MLQNTLPISLQVLVAMFLLLMLVEHEKLLTNHQDFKCVLWMIFKCFLQCKSVAVCPGPRQRSAKNESTATQIRWLIPVADSTEQNLEAYRKEIKISHDTLSFQYEADTSTRAHIQLHK